MKNYRISIVETKESSNKQRQPLKRSGRVGNGHLVYVNHEGGENSIAIEGEIDRSMLADALCVFEKNGLDVIDVFIRYLDLRKQDNHIDFVRVHEKKD